MYTSYLKYRVFDLYRNLLCVLYNQYNSLIFPLFKASFPGNLHLVLVLRPTSFFHRTVTDIGFRFSQEDFMLKMPVRQLPLSYQTCPTSQQGTPHSFYNPDLHESNVLWWTQPRTHVDFNFNSWNHYENKREECADIFSNTSGYFSTLICEMWTVKIWSLSCKSFVDVEWFLWLVFHFGNRWSRHSKLYKKSTYP